MKKLYGLYFLFLFLLSLFSYLFIDSNFIYLKYFYSGVTYTHKELITFLYCFFIFGFFVFYKLFLKLIYKGKIKTIKKLITISILGFVSFFPTVLSYDIFNYIATAKTTFFYKENPYIIMPIEFLHDNLLLFTHAANKVALYGPVWIALTGIPFFVGVGNYIATLLSFKLLIVFFYLLIIFLLKKMGKDISSIAFFVLNPLVLIESLGSGHNDIVMMFFALLSYFLLQKKKIFLSLLFLVLSILIKYSTIFLIPVFLYTLIKILRSQKINWEKIYFFSYTSMFSIFLLSPFREELYPWYAIWFLVYTPFLSRNKTLLNFSALLSLVLMLSYAPYMYLKTYYGITPYLKLVIIVIPTICFFVFYTFKKILLKSLT